MEDLRFRRQVDDCQPYVAGESEASVLRRYGLEKSSNLVQTKIRLRLIRMKKRRCRKA